MMSLFSLQDELNELFCLSVHL